MNKDLTFEELISSIKQAHEELASQASKAVNISLTLRNWIIGCYICEYEQGGADRAEYGEHIIESLGRKLNETLDKCYTERYLRLCRQFYDTYPQIWKSVISKFNNQGKWKPLISKLSEPRITTEVFVPADKILERLSFTHIVELLKCPDFLKRTFYEIECIQGNWSVRELRRQINSLYYERSGLSLDKRKLSNLTNLKATNQKAKLSIRDPYIFEFLGLEPKEVMSESDLEISLLDKLQEFLLEMGHGFCFEARQKRILIGDNYYFIDLVFYHRILKCHVLVELKLDEFNHENIGQLNTYVSWYKKNVMERGDNPPIGILLCTKKEGTLVEYALAGIDNHLFVSKYQLELPKKEEIQKFIEEKIREARE